MNTVIVWRGIRPGPVAPGGPFRGLPMPWPAIVLIVLSVLGLGGCTRAQDGTILYANPVNRLLGTEEPQGRPSTASFPAAPPPPARQASPAPAAAKVRLWDVRPVRPPLVSASTAASLLSCHDETQPGGRVKVVCE